MISDISDLIRDMQRTNHMKKLEANDVTILDNHPDNDWKPALSIVDPLELEMWPHIPVTSKLWDLSYARDVSHIRAAIRQADEDFPISNEEYLIAWLFDICIAYYGVCTFTNLIPYNLCFVYIDMLRQMGFRRSPLLNSPDNIDEDARTAYRTLCKKFRPNNLRFPHLLKQMQWVAVLSEGEAERALAAYIRGEYWSGEAVDHFGGTRAVIAAAFKRRPTYPPKPLAELMLNDVDYNLFGKQEDEDSHE